MDGHPNCRLSAGCQIVSALTFLTSESAKLKQGCMRCETLHSCAKRLGGLAVMTLPRASHSFNLALASTTNLLSLFTKQSQKLQNNSPLDVEVSSEAYSIHAAYFKL